MTLLIGTVSHSAVVLTSDVQSKRNPITGAGIDSDTFQKIFPLPSIPVAVVHHGLNILGGHEVQTAVNNFSNQADLDLSTSSVHEISAKLKIYFEFDAQVAVNDPKNESIVGFWVAGFSPSKARPVLYEIVWPNHPNPKLHTPLIIGGNGRKFICEYLSKRLNQFEPGRKSKYNVSFCSAYHTALYSQAERRQKARGESIFGGAQYQLVIDKIGCRWLKKPSSGLDQKESRNDDPSHQISSSLDGQGLSRTPDQSPG